MIRPETYSDSDIIALERQATASLRDNGHALLSPSGAGHWSRCAGASLDIHKYRLENPDNEASIEGTLAHFLLEITLKLRVSPTLLTSAHKFPEGILADGNRWHSTIIKNPNNSKEVIQYANDSFEKLTHAAFPYEMRMVIEKSYQKIMGYVADGWTLVVEANVSLRSFVGHSQCDGHSDVILYKGTHVIVIDLKYGEAIPIYPENNKQLMLYGLGAVDYIFKRVKEFKGVESMTFVIMQDRINNNEWLEWHTDYKTVYSYVTTTIKLAAIKALYVIANGVSGFEDFSPSEAACAWCNRRKTCTARKKLAEKMAIAAFAAVDKDQSLSEFKPRKHFDPNISPAELRELLANLPFIRAWLNSAEDHAHAQCKLGVKGLGLKLVKGRNNRAFPQKTEHAKIRALVEMGVPFDNAIDTKAMSPAKLEKVKLPPEVRLAVKNSIVSKSGQPIVTLDSDRRPEFNPFEQAQRAFEAVDLTTNCPEY